MRKQKYKLILLNGRFLVLNFAAVKWFTCRIQELPPVDMFVTTADPELEPPILTVNTVISLLAVDYPAGKLACYVSDDGCSPVIYYSLVEASKFARLWVPFCKKHDIQDRAPFRYFSSEEVPLDNSLEFQQEYNKMKVIFNSGTD